MKRAAQDAMTWNPPSAAFVLINLKNHHVTLATKQNIPTKFLSIIQLRKEPVSPAMKYCMESESTQRQSLTRRFVIPAITLKSKSGKLKRSCTVQPQSASAPSVTTHTALNGMGSSRCRPLISASIVTRTRHQAPMSLQDFTAKGTRYEESKIHLSRIGSSLAPAAIILMPAIRKIY